MNTTPWHPALQRRTAAGRVHDDSIATDDAAAIGPACCCPANPVVRVVMPATAARSHRTELLLCGHHYRVSCQALAAANATITAIVGPGGATRVALLPDLPAARVPVG